MSMQDVVVNPVLRYAAQVRACLADLTAADLGELAEDLDDHLTEVAEELTAQWAAGEGAAAAPDPEALWDLLVARLGTPEAYAAELRQAAGLPPGDGRQVESASAVRTVLAWCVLAVALAAGPFVLIGLAVGEPIPAALFAVAVFVACLAALGAAMRAVPSWSGLVAAARGVTADRPPAGTVTPAVGRVATWWLRLLFAGTVPWVLLFKPVNDANVLLLVPWVGTVVIFAVAVGCPPWWAAYTEAVTSLPDAVRLRRLRDRCREHVVGRVTLDFLASLRPAWWLARAWAAVAMATAVAFGDVVAPLSVVGLLAMLVASIGSVWLGMRNRMQAGWNALTVPGNLFAALVLLRLLAGFGG